jgi:predicted transposase YdaD
MLILECSQGYYGWKDGLTEGRTEGRKEGRKEGRTDGSITISLRNFVGEGIIKQQWTIEEISIF